MKDFTYFEGTSEQEETNKGCVALLLVMESGIATPPISLHLSLCHQNLDIPLNIGVNDFAFFVGTKEINQLCVVHGLMLENGIVASDILLHLSLSCKNFAVPPKESCTLHLFLSRLNLESKYALYMD